MVREPDWETGTGGTGGLELRVLALALSLLFDFGIIVLNYTFAPDPVGELGNYGILFFFNFFFTTFNFSFT